MSGKTSSNKHQITHSPQLDFFKLIGKEYEDYSNTIELYDVLPKYYSGNVKRINDKFLDKVEREFVFRGQKKKIEIKPSIIENAKGEEKAYYPAQREEIIEDALKKLATEKGGVFIDGGVGVQFTLYELAKELKKRGHGYNKPQIKEAIKVCHNTAVVLKSENGEDEISFHIFEAIGFSSRGNNEKCFVKFNPLVTKSIKERTYRIYNYHKAMSLKYMLSRWLFKRISHHFLQASVSNPYEIKLTTIIRDSGSASYPKLADNKRQVSKCLDELLDKNVITDYKENIIYNQLRNNKIEDVLYSLWLSESFCKDVKKANYIQGEMRKEVIDVQEELLDLRDELEEEMSNALYKLSAAFIKKYISKIKTKEELKESLVALAAAREAINKYTESGQACQPSALTKKALEEKWIPIVNDNEDQWEEEEEVWGQVKDAKDRAKFNEFLSLLKDRVGASTFNSWFKMNLHKVGTSVELEVKNSFLKQELEDKYSDLIKEAANEIYELKKIKFVVNK